MKNYYFYPPNNPQFFFPKKNFREYKKYYKPFSLKSKVFWHLYSNSYTIRFFFKTTEENIPLPINEIKKIINLKNATYFYNIGSAGIEQKATIISKNKQQQKFLKFAQKQKAIKLVENEIKILKKLENNNTYKVPKVLKAKTTDNLSYVLTEVIEGNKVNFTSLNNKVFQFLINLTKQNKFDKFFTHGDFCPWNMLLLENGELVLIDWEMSGYKEVGYDLFTFIFQTNFLLFPHKSIHTILLENKKDIEKYFKILKIKNWKKYLVKFAKIKTFEEKQKSTSLLFLKYQKLANYYGKY